MRVASLAGGLQGTIFMSGQTSLGGASPSKNWLLPRGLQRWQPRIIPVVPPRRPGEWVVRWKEIHLTHILLQNLLTSPVFTQRVSSGNWIESFFGFPPDISSQIMQQGTATLIQPTIIPHSVNATIQPWIL